jgi:exopolysaccharide biosynthesis polyprenyl glycosylphosphotransferase
MSSVGWVYEGKGPIRDDFLGHIEDFWGILQRTRVNTVVLCGLLSEEAFESVIEASTTAGCRVLATSREGQIPKVRAGLVSYHGIPFVQLMVPSLRAQQLMIKRVIDFFGAMIGLLLLWPVFLVVAIATRFDSGGPVFFSQERVGFAGRLFRMWKFRTMRNGADGEKESVAHLNRSGDPRLFKIPNDPRVTRVGALLRRWSIDELPQLWNVLLGHMSLVGPRPFFESDLVEYSDHHFHRLGVKPGITGLWQVRGRSSLVDFEEVVRLDREYIDRWSLWLDVAILMGTVPAVLRRTGAY